MGHTLTEKVLQREGCPIHYWISENNNENWLFFFHGAACDHRMFVDQIKAIPTSYNILLWDERGHGNSRPIGESFSFDMIIEDIVQIMDREKCHKATFIGHSQGGQISQELAYRYSSKVDNLILIGSNCITKELTIIERVVMLIMPTLLKISPWRYLVKQNVKICSKNKEIRKYVEDCYGTVGKEDFRKIILETQDSFHYERDYSIDKPMLFLYGEYDRTLYTKRALEYWSTQVNTCKCYLIKDAGHNANQDNPDLVNKLILDFIDNH